MKPALKVLLVAVFVLAASALAVQRCAPVDVDSLSSTLQVELVEVMTDWDSVYLSADDATPRRVQARRVVGSIDADILHLEHVRFESENLNIQADSGEWHREENTLILEHSVRITLQDATNGEVYLSAEYVLVYDTYADTYGFHASGEPAHFTHKSSQSATDTPRISGQAQYMEYDGQTDILVLTGDAKIENSGYYLRGDELQYAVNDE